MSRSSVQIRPAAPVSLVILISRGTKAGRITALSVICAASRNSEKSPTFVERDKLDIANLNTNNTVGRKMIGLKRGSVELAPYDPSWRDEFEKEKDTILLAVSVSITRIDHIGSTAIPGIKAKPLIDIAMEVESESAIESIAACLASHGYTYFGDRENRGDYFLAKGPDSKRTHYLHISTKNSSRYDEAIYFRDRLIEDSDLAREYEKIKESLALEFREERNEYTKRKESFIERVMKNFSNKAVQTTSASRRV